MALVFADRVKESTTSTGTGPLTLAGAESGFRAFSSVCADGDTTYYCVTDGTSWEVGLGTYAAGVLTRTTVLSSSNGGAAVSLNPGPKDVFLTVPAQVIAASRPYVGPSSGLTAGTVDGQLAFATDLPGPVFFYEALIWAAGDWQFITAYDATAHPVWGTHASITATTGVSQGQLGIATDEANKAYIWDGGTAWLEFIAKDPTARTAAANAQTTADGAAATATDAVAAFVALAPVFGAGTPAATSQPTDGTVVNYYNTAVTPYVHYVFDGSAFHQVA